MHLSWHGQYTIKIQTRETTLVIDPYSPSTGLRPFRSHANVSILSNPTNAEMSHTLGIQGDGAILNGPGEFTIGGFTLHAIPWRSLDNTERSIQRLFLEGLCLVNLASLNRELTNGELQEIEKTNIDVLLTPAGGGSALNAKQAVKLVTTLEPRLVIPIHVALPGLKEKLDRVDIFAKEFGVKPSHTEKKIVIKSSRLPKEEMQVAILIP